ncbi:quinon protein alcohol dehydrogenase-like superfamily [Coprinopsis sp. MPI-PUGE-AT-0042]|nr:quinon protein alcohol dehydrogenase-like superfamily [Coprinopsis sp. MPI-PUGE-AT-0042]
MDSTEQLPPPTSATSSNPPDRNGDLLKSLVEILLKKEHAAKAATKAQAPNFEDDRDVPSVDEHLQAAGAETFHRFQRSANALDKELRNFANASRQLGSSVAILASGFHLRERLAQLLYLYRENAADLFPRKLSHVSRDAINSIPTSVIPGRRKKRTRMMRGKAPHLHVPRPTISENLEAEDFPDQLEQLAKDVRTFLNCLNEFPEFTDEAVNASILSFEGDLRYWASCLREYAGQFKYPAVQRYIHDLSHDIGEHLDTITSSLCMFIEVGVPTIRFAQKHGSGNLLNLSTIATFFSAVTATTLQFSLELEFKGPASHAVNCFWFSSLVFSIAAAVNSLLGLTWKQAMYRSPGHRVPWWVLIWIKRSPLVFLVFSVACFSIGLCVFAYASAQDNVTSTVTTVLTAFTSFGLAAVSAWFASERWAFSRHRGQKWLIDVLHESMEEFIRLPGINWIYKSSKYLTRNTVKLWRRCKQTASTLLDVSRSCLHRRSDEEESEGADDIEAMRYSTNSKSATIAPPFSPELKSERVSADTIVMPIAEEPLQLPATPVNSPASPGFSESSGMPTSPLAAAELMSPPPSIAAPAPPSQGKKLWKNAIRTVKIHQQQAAATSMGANESSNSESAPPPSGRFPLRRRTTSSGMTGATSGLPFNEKKKTLTLPEPIAMAKSRITSLIPKLAMLEPTQDLPAHNALVRHLQFSPDGKYLATSSWDRTSVIFRVGDPFVQHRVLAHTQGFVGQVAWSPAGNILLTKLPRGIKIWAADTSRTDSVTTRICTRPIDRGVPVETLTWMPDGESFLSVEETSTVSKINLQGKVLEQYDFGPVRLHDVAVTPDSLRLVGVGPLIESPTGLKPSKSRQEKRLVVYNLETKQIESRIPLLNEVRDITIGTNVRGDWIALVSYENKAPPQLWKIELVRDRENSNTIARLTLRHTYMPKTPVDFAGPSYFGGKNNELVLCPGKAGDIHIWDQESGALVHFIRGQAHGGDMTCLAWNHAHDDSFMFATGSHDGGVRIWTRLEPEVQEVPFLERRPSYPMASRFPFMIPRTESPEPDNASTHSAHPTTPQPPPPRHRARAISFSSSGSSKL